MFWIYHTLLSSKCQDMGKIFLFLQKLCIKKSKPEPHLVPVCLYFLCYTLTQSLVISAKTWTPHICMVSASSAWSFCVKATAPSAPPP